MFVTSRPEAMLAGEIHHAIVLLVCSIPLVTADLKPFDDSILFKITWPTADSLLKNNDLVNQKQDDGKDYESLWVVSADKERYQCLLPKTVSTKKGEEKGEQYRGPTPLTLLKPLFVRTFCSYRLEQYWTYELCHGKRIRQYHEESLINKVSVQEFYLGKYDAQKLDRDEANYLIEYASKQKGGTKKVDTIRVEGLEMPFFAINMSDGTLCDINGMQRSTRVLYVCNEDAKNEVISIEEVSTCEYQAVVLTPFLCKHPDYRFNVASENDILCLARDGAPSQPKSLQQLQEELLQLQSPPSESVHKPDPIMKPTWQSKRVVDSMIVESSSPHDPKLVRDFLSGDHCLSGGTGWWQYEFCYGKKVVQFHEEKGKPRIEILLGMWDKEKHIAWLSEHPRQKPKPGKAPRYISHFYSDGDVCDLTGSKRTVEVRLKCKDVKGHPDSVTLYLLEPKSCEYILGVESPIICSIMENLDENGLQAPATENV
ncbi:endoplasmic reticulum lectin 1-like [Ornithodoros turicata]|uniref:endoplasmic reticulum lectin 1-like n=1 Tax=Ornithodoros turicata TaxID=34597 RepID=UPI00313A10FA